MEKEHIKEVELVEDANNLIESHDYRLERFSETKNLYILVKRIKKLK